MSSRPEQMPCNVSDRGVPIADFSFNEGEFAILTIARHYFTSFSEPQTQGWMWAISEALDVFDHNRAPHVAVAVLTVVQAMRRSRRSTFRFNSPTCPVCSRYLSLSERGLMNTLRASARGQADAAIAHAMLLCEGNDVRPMMVALDGLVAQAFPPREDPRPHAYSNDSRPGERVHG